MSIPKIKGIETEFSIVSKWPGKSEPAFTTDYAKMIDIIKQFFALPTDSAVASLREIENIERIRDPDLRRSRISASLASSISHHNLLPNGARLYIDGDHLEYSTAECLSAKTLVAADRAGEVFVSLAQKKLNEALSAQGRALIVRKDNSDRNGTSYGCHENYLVSRDCFHKIMDPGSFELGYLASFFICRLIFIGSGKLGVETEGTSLSGHESVYQISQRADFISQILNKDTIFSRAIVNARDEPLADRIRFGRLHVIAGDANLAEIANYMKVGITSIVLKMLEDGFLEGDIIPADPVDVIKLVSRNLDCQKPVLQTLNGRALSALNLNEEFFQRASAYFSTVCEPTAEEKDLLQKWEETISDFRTGNEARLQRRLDWKIKQMVLNDFLAAYGIPWLDIGRATIKDGRKNRKVVDLLSAKDILYHDLDRERGLYWTYKDAGLLEELVSKDDVLNLVQGPPTECRSYFRGRCIGKFFEDMDYVDWDNIIFKKRNVRRGVNFSLSSSPLDVELTNPVWGGKDDVGELLDKATNYKDLVEALHNLE